MQIYSYTTEDFFRSVVFLDGLLFIKRHTYTYCSAEVYFSDILPSKSPILIIIIYIRSYARALQIDRKHYEEDALGKVSEKNKI